MPERLTEEEIDRLILLTQDGVSGNTRLLLTALRQVRGDLKAREEKGKELIRFLEIALRQADAAREQVRVLREILSEINEGIIDQRRRNYCDICYCVGTHKQTCRMVVALAASEQEEAK